MECNRCQSSIPYRHRTRMGCGWVSKRDWASQVSIPRVPGTEPGAFTICPYYAATLPQVQEAAIAWTWRDKGQLQLRYEKPAPVLLDLIDVYHGAVHQAQDYLLAENQRKVRAHGS